MARHQRIDLSVIRAIEAERDAAREERDRALQQVRISRSLANDADENSRLAAHRLAELMQDRARLENALREAYRATKWCYLCNARIHKPDCLLRG